MASQEQHGPGGHYSGSNPIPTIAQFISNLDKDKKERDKNIDHSKPSGTTATSAGRTTTHSASQVKSDGDSHTHEVQHAAIEGSRKVVTDPTTGQEVVIEDVSKAGALDREI